MNREFADIVERAVIVALTAYVAATIKGLITVVKSPSRGQPARLSQMSVSFRKALFTSGVVGYAFPAPVLLIQDDFTAGNPHHVPVPQHDQSLFVVSLFDHCDSATEHRHAVALLQGALPLAADVILVACLDQVVQSRRVEA